MKKLCVLLSLFFVCCFCLSAQNGSFTTVTLNNGTSLKAQVEKQTYGGYKLTTEDGSVFFFNENEIKSFGPASVKPAQELKYWELKQKYSAKGYQRELGDRYNPSAIGWASFFVPGLGHYITGTNIGIGVLQTALGLSSLGVAFFYLDGFSKSREYSKYSHDYYYNDYCKEMMIIHFSIFLGPAIWSACSASKAAKIKNLYYRDVRNGVAFKFDVAPYFDVASPMLASNTGVVSGLSLRISF